MCTTRLNNMLVMAGGILLILLGLVHISFWHMFDWKNELVHLSQENMGMMQIFNLCFIVLLVSLGVLILANRAAILHTKMGKHLLLMLSVFFAVRLIAEFIFPGGSLWLAAILFMLLWVFLIPAITKTA